MKKVLVAGATGYLGRYIVKELKKQAYIVHTLARNPEKLEDIKEYIDDIIEGEVTKPETLKGVCENIDIIISTVGITKQKDSLTYMDVDYQANKNLLDMAQKSGVKKFIYVSVLNGEKLKNLRICNAKELFVEQLKKSGMEYCIIRPNGFFSDMSEFFSMAKKGRVYLFGNGKLRANPIHGEDLAVFCVNTIERHENEIEIGGPETLTQNEIALMAFDILGRRPKITYIPDWVRITLLKLVKIFTGKRFYGPVEFFMTVMAIDMLAPEYGKRTLKEHFINLHHSSGH